MFVCHYLLMIGIKVRKNNAEKVRRYLARHKLMDNNYRIFGSDKFIYFPFAGYGGKAVSELKRRFGAGLAEVRFEKAAARASYGASLPKGLDKKHGGAARGYDIVGDIALVDAANCTAAKRMAAALMKANRSVKTVLAKEGPVKGKYRIRNYRYVAGRKRYDTIYKENGAAFELDVRKTFFSPRLAYERNRIRSLAKAGEKVVVMFAGVGPFAIEIAKAHKDSEVVAIELNRQAYNYMVKNIRLNKTKNVKAELGDVKKVASKYKAFADRIVMPLPKDSYEFLDSVLKVAKKRCIVHYYAFGDRDSAFKQHISRLRGFFSRHGRSFRVSFKRTVRPYSPREIEVVIDFVIF